MSFFDTSFLIDLLREQRRNLRGPAHSKLESLGDTPIRISVFVVCELEDGRDIRAVQELLDIQDVSATVERGLLISPPG